MDPYRITHYKLNWSLEVSLGKINILAVSGAQSETIEIAGIRSSDYLVMVDMLRNEKPVYWDKDSQELYTGSEMVGEEEG